MSEYPSALTENVLMEALKQHGVPVDRWGSGSAKTVSRLLGEIEAGETTLVKDGRELLRRTRFVALTVTHQGEEGEQELYEKEQVFKDGRPRIRNLDWSASEKLLGEEDSQAALNRLLSEELFEIAAGIEGIISTGETEEIKESPSYPGLKTEFKRYNFEGELRGATYKPEGYTLQESDKTTHFAWRVRKP